MFQHLTSYILGSYKCDASDVTSIKEVSGLCDDDDWLLVQPADYRTHSTISGLSSSKTSSLAPEEEEAFVCIETEQCLEDIVDGRLTESWLITPPACFTAEEAVPSPVLTNSLEDLLIEHPSMSVYTNKKDGLSKVGTIQIDDSMRMNNKKDGCLKNGAIQTSDSATVNNTKHALCTVGMFKPSDMIRLRVEDQNELNLSKCRLDTNKPQLTRCIGKFMKQSVANNAIDLSVAGSCVGNSQFKRRRHKTRHGNGPVTCR